MVTQLSNYYYLVIVIIIISNSLTVFCQRAFSELIKEPVMFVPYYNRVINHVELPFVIDELSITLKIYIAKHYNEVNSFHNVFYKGIYLHMIINYIFKKVLQL